MVPETMSSGVHGDISNAAAKMFVIYNYLDTCEKSSILKMNNYLILCTLH